MPKPEQIGILIPEFPGQTHSFFWREALALTTHYAAEVKIISTRKPPLPVQHDWIKDAKPEYLHPVPLKTVPYLVAGVLGFAGLLLKDPKSREILNRPKSWSMVLFALRLKAICAKNAITYVHVHSCANAALIAAFCKKIGGPSYGLTLHGNLDGYGGHQDFKWRNATHLFAVSNALVEQVADQMPDIANRVRIAPMGVDTDRFKPAEEKSPILNEFSWFVCARLNPGKGFETLLKAASRLADSHAFQIRIAGEDDIGGDGYRKTLEADIIKYGLEDRVTLIGAIPQDQVLQELKKSDGFVLPSLHEAIGVAYMEAMSCGLPVIGSRTGGVPELIEDNENGLLVSPGDTNALALKMAMVMESPDLRADLGRKARDTIVSHFNVRRSADALAAALALSKRSSI